MQANRTNVEMLVFVAQMETENFSFCAIGETEAAALDALARGWDAHAGQYCLEMSAEQALEDYGASCVAMPMGRCTIDRELL